MLENVVKRSEFVYTREQRYTKLFIIIIIIFHTAYIEQRVHSASESAFHSSSSMLNQPASLSSTVHSV